jgi:hypothetical protein
MELRVVKDAPHGSKRDSYPFLLDSNEQDKALIRNLLVYRPFLQKKGKQTTACNDFEDEYDHNCLQDAAPSKTTTYGQLPEDDACENVNR